MFDERRSRAGIDKSYLLEPIAVETTKTTINSKRQVGPAKVTTTSVKSRDQKMSNYSKVIVPPLQNRNIINHDINGNNNHFRNASDDPIDRTFRPGDTAIVNFSNKAKVGVKTTVNASTTRRPTPAVTSSNISPPLKNVTNQKVKK